MNSTIDERIKQLLAYKGLTAGEFATEIGILPSTVSHVLKGRNKPSQPFIEKLLSTYNDVNARWLLLGDGEISKSEVKQEQPNLFTANIETKPTIEAPLQIELEKPDEPKEKLEPIFEKKEKRSIIKIITIYSDQTFEEYTPSK